MLLQARIAQVLKLLPRRAEHNLYARRIGHIDISVCLINGNRQVRFHFARELHASGLAGQVKQQRRRFPTRFFFLFSILLPSILPAGMAEPSLAIERPNR